MDRAANPRPKIALALAGGGPLGAIYEIGALCALEESLNGLDLTRLQHYVGVSSGGFIAAGLANGMTPRELCTAFIEEPTEPPGDSFDPSWLMRPAYGEFASRAALWPGLLVSALWHLAAGRKTLMRALEHLGPGLPTGVFANDQIHAALAALFSKPGRSNDFRQLRTQLTLVATDLDTGEAAPFGRPGWDHVPISRAVQASAALPGLFPPVAIDGGHYVDGALKKTLHASVALEDGLDLLLCLNPLVPFDATAPRLPDTPHLTGGAQPIPRIVEGGLPAVLSQTFRSLIHSRMVLGMKQYERSYPHTDIILIEPDHQDPELYLANTFSYTQRRHVAEHAYQQTRHLLRSPSAGLAAKLLRHGITLHHAALDDTHRQLCAPPAPPARLGQAARRLDAVLDDLGHALHALAQPERRAW
jgi:NTE family protein